MRFILILPLAFLAFGFWLGEVRLVKGWEGLNWLEGYPWSAVPICLLIAGGAWIGSGSKSQVIRAGLFLILTGGILLACFELARASLYALHSVGFILYLPDLLKQGSLWSKFCDLLLFLGVPLAVLLASLGIYFLVRLFLMPISRWTIFFLLAGMALIMPASMVAIRLLPAIKGSRDYLHAVKMGYPAFWAVILVGTAVMLGRYATREQK